MLEQSKRSKTDAFSKWNRRDFLKQSAVAVMSIALGNFPFISEARRSTVTKLTILHTNDWHSRIEPFPMYDRTYSGLGGAEARSALIHKIRQTEKNILLLDAGDIFQGTPYFNFYGGELEYKLMSQMGYDCATLGNHDFDNGIDGLVKQLPHAKFDLVNCNYNFSSTKLSGIIKPYKIISKGNIKIGVTGVGIELKGLVPDRFFEQIEYKDPIENANYIASKLKKEEKCDIVICLSHLGHMYESGKISDKILAAHSQNIDLIIGGHTHTFLNIPETVTNAIGKPVLINQVGWGGINLGRIDFYFEKDSREPVKYQSFVHCIDQKV